MGESLKVYHPTLHAHEITRDGFGEESGTYLTENNHSGVWVFDRWVDTWMGGGEEAVMLELDLPEALLLPYESGANHQYRQFLVPAAVLNLYGPPHIIERRRVREGIKGPDRRRHVADHRSARRGGHVS